MCYTQLPNLEKKLLSLKNRIYVFSMEISSLIENKNFIKLMTYL